MLRTGKYRGFIPVVPFLRLDVPLILAAGPTRMPKKNNFIPVNKMTSPFGGDVTIERTDVGKLLASYKSTSADPEEGHRAHRHDRHSFFLLESGSVSIEIDFQKYTMKAPSVIYLHPDQVHRTSAYKKVIVSSWAMNNENLNPEYLRLLEDIRPAKPLPLKKETFSIISEAVSLSLKFAERESEKLYVSLLRDSCNTMVALVLSQYLAQSKPTDKFSRFEIITKEFKKQLERDYRIAKRPAIYAKKLHLSIPYLNECVKNTSGHSVSHHIQQRVILEAKRLLYHSGQSVKEIATELGYDDYPYFSRLFTRVTGMTALAFRNKNRD